MDESPIEADPEAFATATEFPCARILVEVGLPPADESLFADAKTAVRQEC